MTAGRPGPTGSAAPAGSAGSSGPSRRRFLAGGAGVAAGAGLLLTRAGDASAQGTDGHGTGAHGTGAHGTGAHGGGGHGGGINGATFRAGQVVDHTANGFHPTQLLRSFDTGRVSALPDGRTLREWEVVAVDKDVEVAPGVSFPAWTFDGRIPGPTLRCREGDRLRVRFVNGSAHPHTMHFHGIHPADMDGVRREWGEVVRLAPDSDVAKTVKAHLDALSSAAPSARTPRLSITSSTSETAPYNGATEGRASIAIRAPGWLRRMSRTAGRDRTASPSQLGARMTRLVTAAMSNEP